MTQAFVTQMCVFTAESMSKKMKWIFNIANVGALNIRTDFKIVISSLRVRVLVWISMINIGASDPDHLRAQS